jgi:BirA family biotin operon repressor/biotin-[acetyl-CoA-carboxylase] ligase
MATSVTALHLPTTSSTQDEARRRFAGVPVLVTAGAQAAGRGRSGAKWVDADRALAASVAFGPRWVPSAWPRIPLVAGLAAVDVLGDVGLKWPNDVVRGSAKIAGILSESDGTVVVVGMGVNLWWPSPIEGAGALWDEDPGPGAGWELAESWVARLLDRLEADPDDWGREEYESCCTVIGREITWDPGGSGIATGVDAFGRLIVDVGGELEALDSEEVRLVRAALSDDATGDG